MPTVIARSDGWSLKITIKTRTALENNKILITFPKCLSLQITSFDLFRGAMFLNFFCNIHPMHPLSTVFENLRVYPKRHYQIIWRYLQDGLLKVIKNWLSLLLHRQGILGPSDRTSRRPGYVFPVIRVMSLVLLKKVAKHLVPRFPARFKYEGQLRIPWGHFRNRTIFGVRRFGENCVCFRAEAYVTNSRFPWFDSTCTKY